MLRREQAEEDEYVNDGAPKLRVRRQRHVGASCTGLGEADPQPPIALYYEQGLKPGGGSATL